MIESTLSSRLKQEDPERPPRRRRGRLPGLRRGSRRARVLVGILTVLAAPAVLPSGQARAQDAGGPRFRAGIGVSGGMIAIPNVGSGFNVRGMVLELGVQIDDRWGLYARPSFGLFTEGDSAFTFGASLLADYTFSTVPISLAAGPEVTQAVCFTCADGPGPGAKIDGLLVGGVTRLSFHPLLRRSGTGRRHALTLGVELHVDGRPSGFATYDIAGDVVGTSPVSISPMAFIGYTTF